MNILICIQNKYLYPDSIYIFLDILEHFGTYTFYLNLSTRYNIKNTAIEKRNKYKTI